VGGTEADPPASQNQGCGGVEGVLCSFAVFSIN